MAAWPVRAHRTPRLATASDVSGPASTEVTSRRRTRPPSPRRPLSEPGPRRRTPMPELPEVEVVRRGLDRWVTGRTVADVEVRHPRATRRHAAGPADFAARLRGRRVVGVHRRGKYLWLALDHAHPAGAGEALLAHLGMSGQMLVQPVSAPMERHLRVRFALSGGPLGEQAGSAEALEAGELELDRHAGLPGGLDRQAAVARDRGGGHRHRRDNHRGVRAASLAEISGDRAAGRRPAGRRHRPAPPGCPRGKSLTLHGLFPVRRAPCLQAFRNDRIPGSLQNALPREHRRFFYPLAPFPRPSSLHAAAAPDALGWP